MAGMIRKYSIAELNQMRQAILQMLTLADIESEAQVGLLVEARLQTHVLANTDPEDLVQAANNWPICSEDA